MSSLSLNFDDLEEFFIESEVNMNLLKEALLSQQPCTYRHRVGEAYVKTYTAQASYRKVNTMQVSHFSGTRYSPER